MEVRAGQAPVEARPSPDLDNRSASHQTGTLYGRDDKSLDVVLVGASIDEKNHPLGFHAD